MRASVNHFLLSGAICALLGAPAFAEGSGQEGADRFVPSLAAITGVTVQEWSGKVRSSICRGCNFPDPAAEELRIPDSDSDRDVTPYVGARLELMTPEAPIFGSPRLFFGGEFGAAFGFERKLAREGDAGIVGSPLPAAPNLNYGEDDALGQGSETIAQMDHFIYGASAGVAVPVELFGRAMRIRTSFAWIHYDIDLEGIVTDAECGEVNGQNECNPNNGGFTRAITLEASASETFDGIGPGLGLEIDTGRWGPLGTSLFMGGHLYKILGDRTLEFSTPVVTASDQLGTDENQANFTFEMPSWIYRVGLGMRFQWLGKQD